MTQYLLSVHSVEGEPAPSPEQAEKMYRDVDVFNAELQAAGAWVFAGGLHPPGTATVVRLRDGELLTTDGPFVEGKEHIGGFTVIEAPDLDGALVWGGKLARALTIDQRGGLPIEVRPLHDEAEA